MKLYHLPMLAAIFGTISSPASGDDWLRFRGPNGSGVSAETQALPARWAPDANVKWKAELPGPGVSSPIVVGGKVFVTCYSGYGLTQQNPGDIKNLVRHLVCLDATTGSVLWQKDIAAAQPEDPYTGIGVTAHGYASHTPVSDGKNVYCFFGKSGVFAFDMDGNQLWKTGVGTESDPKKWGSSSSPVLHEDVLIITAAAESQSLVGLDKNTGKEVWRQEASGLDNTWGTPTLVQVDDSQTDLVISVPKEMWGLDPATGKLRWYCEATGADQTHSSAVAADGKVIAFTGRGGGSVAVQTGGKGNVTESKVLWTGRDSTRFTSPVGFGNKVFLVANGIVSTIDASNGKKLGQARLSGGSSAGGRSLDYPSPIVADNKLFYLKGNGDMFVFDVSGDKPEQIAVNRISGGEGESFGGSPAVANGSIYLRSSKSLYCVTDKGDEVKPMEQVAQQAEEGGDRGGFGGRPGGGRGGAGRGGPGGPGGRRSFDPASIFANMDKDSDGKLSKSEVSSSPMGSRMGSMDKDGDEQITLEEFRAGLSSMFRGGGGRGGYRGGGEDNRPKRPQRPKMDA